MKKFLILISVLLLAGTVHAVEMNQAITSELTAQNTGRSVATDSSVVLQVWGDAGTSAYPGVGVSSSSAIVVYSDYVTGVGYTINPTSTSYDTIGEIVDYINQNFATDSSVKLHAAVGTDAYRDMPSDSTFVANIDDAGTTRATSAVVKSGSSRRISVGAQDASGVTPRIKSISYQVPFQDTIDGYITLKVYDGNTKVWQRTTSIIAYNTATDLSNSCNSVVFDSFKGIAATKGNSLCVVAESTANAGASTAEKALRNIAILYDLYRD